MSNQNVTVHIEADTSGYTLALADQVGQLRLCNRIRHERATGLAYVDGLLDDMCHDLGLDPLTTWRIPRQQERELAVFRSALRAADAVLTERLNRFINPA